MKTFCEDLFLRMGSTEMFCDFKINIRDSAVFRYLAKTYFKVTKIYRIDMYVTFSNYRNKLV